jgi:glycosyltransferase involved in cell wall biosynthesis
MRIFLLMLLSFFVLTNGEASTQAKKTVCLNMIVKNESEIITRCLTSVLPFIDYWIIVDTGSTDGTQKIIKDFMQKAGKPGELHERPWVNFSHNRNEALNLAKNKGDYLLFIDADEYLVYAPDFKLPLLDKDFYYIMMDGGGTFHARTHFINNHLNWKWIGVLHEYVYSSQAKSSGTIDHMTNIYTSQGARTKDPHKYEKDAQILEAALKDEPNNSRYVYYLAQSYRCCGNLELALKNYEKLIAMGSWEEEVFTAMLIVGQLQEELKMPSHKIVESFYRAYNYRCTRAEPLYYLANYYRRNGNYAPGYLVASTGLNISQPSDLLLVENWIYDWGMLLEFSICAHYVGRYEEAKQADLALLAKQNLPENVKECIQNNMKFTDDRLVQLNRTQKQQGFIPYTVLHLETMLQANAE